MGALDFPYFSAKPYMTKPTTCFSLDNGLRCVHRQVPGAADCCGVIIDAGSRDEPTPDQGLAHFVEHTIFKGTSRRKSWHIINRMESVGGELNAYTTKESTAVYTLAPRGNLARSVELLADLIASSSFPAAELDKEREVVADEIDSYLDMPSEAVIDEFDELFFAGNPLAHNILGTEKTVATFKSADCRRWLDTRYSPSRMVFFYSGAMNVRQVAQCVSRHFSALNRTEHPLMRTQPDAVAPFDAERPVGSHQAHTLMGCPIGGMGSDDRFAMSLLTNIVGGPGMNSLLNVALRERRGLVYNVEAMTTRYTDCGVFAVYFGCDHADTRQCTDLTLDIISSLRTQPLTPRRLLAAKRQFAGQLALASENRENDALAMGKAVLYHGSVLEPSEMRRRIDELTADDLYRCAQQLDPARFSRLTLC